MSAKITHSDYASYSKEFRNAWNEGRLQAKAANDALNGMIKILHYENPDWSMNQLANKIAGDHSDLEGFSLRQIYRDLDDENKKIVVDKSSDMPVKPKTPKKDTGQNSTPASGDQNVDDKFNGIGVNLKHEEEIEQLKKKLEIVTQEKEQALKDKAQLGQVVGKDSFKKASDPENMDVEYFPKISMMELIGKIRSKQASGWHFVENRMRYIS